MPNNNVRENSLIPSRKIIHLLVSVSNLLPSVIVAALFSKVVGSKIHFSEWIDDKFNECEIGNFDGKNNGYLKSGLSFALRKASDILDQMIDTHKPFSLSDVVDAVASVRMFDEAVCLLLSFKNADMFPNSVCLNSMMNDLLRNNKMDLFWKVNERLVEANMTRDVYTYSHVIMAYCKSGKMDETKRRFQDAKLLLEDMLNAGLYPDSFTYTALIDGFLKQGEVDEVFKMKNEMVAKGIKVNLVTFNCIIDGLCKLG
ncbi:pentatricopeptide repeat-containing protein At5g64320, mitochondrial-like [Helianthus annuus]|uniref:pentatricopeptide repeat-containing protein At5g64320, mitochondrial-like n=1 Tax=Helianthus annuus TaxID=4232 RepID=UPI000B90958A|nr:pentatricopeptide repeat-containing protein At5g64320, mitochondrial-like [Helianthus annuus]